jgi:hypothetical protein
MSNTKIEGELFPFEGMPQQDTNTTAGDAATTPDGGKSLVEELKELREQCAAAGIYTPLPTDALLLRGEAYYYNTAPQIRDFLTTSGVTESTVNAVLTDYAATLMGFFNPQATPRQMAEVLHHLKPYRAYYIDRYALYWILCTNCYTRYLNTFNAYQSEVKNTDSTATDETRRKFMDSTRSLADSRAVTWLVGAKIMVPADFIGVDTAKVLEFFKRVQAFGMLSDYCQYVFIAKYTLSATPEELADITPPPFTFKNIDAVKFATDVAEDAVGRINDNAEQFAKLFEAEHSEVPESARRTARIWSENGNKPLKTYQTFNTILSCPILISPNGADVQNISQLQKYIDEFNKEFPQFGGITIATVTRAFEGMNLLPNFLRPRTDSAHTYDTTSGGFAEICGYADANQPTKLKLLGSLLMLSRLYVIVRRMKWPKKYKYHDIFTAVQVCNVPRYDFINGEAFTLYISPEALAGKPTLITPDTLKRLRAEARGLAQTRFYYQILAKGHKDADEMVAEVFGYDEKLKQAEDDADALATVKKYIRGHRCDDRKKLEKMFSDYAAKGEISYKYTPPTGTRGGGSYSWKRLKAAPTDTAQKMPPEEQ